MKSKEVKLILNCSYTTLLNYVKQGKLKLNKILPNGYYDYDEESVYSLVGLSYLKDKSSSIIIFLDGLIFNYLLPKNILSSLKQMIDIKILSDINMRKFNNV